MSSKILYIASGLAVVVLVMGCESLRYETKGSIEVASWIGLEAGGKKLSSIAPSFTSVDSVVFACWTNEVDGELPSYVKDMNIDSVNVEIENLDTLHDVELRLYVSENSFPCEDLSSATIIATVNLIPGEQLIIGGQNFHDYFSNLNLLADIAKDGQFWAYVKASGPDHVHVELSGYTFHVTVWVGLW